MNRLLCLIMGHSYRFQLWGHNTDLRVFGMITCKYCNAPYGGPQFLDIYVKEPTQRKAVL